MGKNWSCLLAAALWCLGTMSLAQPLPKVHSGTLERLENFPSRWVEPRHVEVWLPPDYDRTTRHNVLYMHDGQMLFDAQTTWNKQAWNVDVTLERLMREKRIAPTIVVGIWNNGKYRHAEYFPEKHLGYLSQTRRRQHLLEKLEGRALADNYLRFLVEELKPAIDNKFATAPDAAHTFIMGSSMGGLISVYAMNEYPEVFGAAAGLSTHWSGVSRPNAELPLAAFNYLRDHLAAPETHRLYQDHGTTELDALYAPYQVFVDELVRERGYTAANFQSRVFEGTGHNENAWASRLEIPVLFLLGSQRGQP